MKSAQISGFLMTLLGGVYLYSFAHGISESTSTAPTAGIGVVVVFSLLLVSAVSLMHSSVRLSSRISRLREPITHIGWLPLLGINSILAGVYTVANVARVVAVLNASYAN